MTTLRHLVRSVQGNGATEVVETYGWLGAGDAAAFVSVVSSASSASSASALPERGPVVIVAPYGVEALGSDRSLRDLGVRLATNGHLVVHVEAPDTGDGAGHQLHEDRLGRWTNAVTNAVRFARSEREGAVTVVAMRLGALPAVLAAASSDAPDASPDRLVLWAPVIRGRLYVRELKLASATGADAGAGSSESGLQAGGFLLPPAFADALSAVDLATIVPTVSAALVIDRDDLPQAAALAPAWREQDIDVTEVSAPGFASLVADDPEKGQIADAVNDAIVQWCADITDTTGTADAAGSAPVPSPIAIRSEIELDHGLRESTVAFGDDASLLGIITRPPTPSTSRPVIVLLTTGSNVRSGTGRLSTTVARRWAEGGNTVVRYDRRGIGGSGSIVEWTPPPGFTIGNSYADQHIDDLAAVLRSLRAEGHDRSVVVGLCSGAWLAYRACVDIIRPDVATPLGGVAINQVLWDDINWGGGDSESPAIDAKVGRELRRSITNPKRWADLLGGDIPVRANAKRLGRLAVSKAKQRLNRGPSALAGELRSVADRGIWQVQVFDTDELGIAYLTQHGGEELPELLRRRSIERHDTSGAGHTFAPAASKAWLVETLDRALTERGVFTSSP